MASTFGRADNSWINADGDVDICQPVGSTRGGSRITEPIKKCKGRYIMLCKCELVEWGESGSGHKSGRLVAKCGQPATRELDYDSGLLPEDKWMDSVADDDRWVCDSCYRKVQEREGTVRCHGVLKSGDRCAWVAQGRGDSGDGVEVPLCFEHLLKAGD